VECAFIASNKYLPAITNDGIYGRVPLIFFDEQVVNKDAVIRLAEGQSRQEPKLPNLTKRTSMSDNRHFNDNKKRDTQL